MSLALLHSPSSHTRLPRAVSTSSGSSMSSRQSVFGSIKGKFSRKSSGKESKSPRQPSLELPSEIRQSRSMDRDANRSDLLNPSTPTRRPDRPGMNAFTTPSNEPPPAYTAAPAMKNAASSSARSPSAARSTHSVAPSVISTADDPYAFLSSFDTVFLIDDSGSMAGRSWRETSGALETIAPICTAHDEDGIDIYFLNQADRPSFQRIKSVATVREIFETVRPMGATPTGQRLDRIMRPYLQRYEENPTGTKPLNIIVITDGIPSDDVESVIVNSAAKLDKLDAPAWQVGIQFFQVGNEPSAKEHLKQLDDDLAEIAGRELRDMVDTVPFTGSGQEQLNGEGILKVVLGAVNRRLDRKKSQDLHRRSN